MNHDTVLAALIIAQGWAAAETAARHDVGGARFGTCLWFGVFVVAMIVEAVRR